MTAADYGAAYELWIQTEGMSLGDDDTEDRIRFYLARNPGLCFVATVNGSIVGTVLCGHEGRRGILRHLAVQRAHRGQGIGRELVRTCLQALAGQGIRRCNTFVLDANAAGLEFWTHLGWAKLEDDYRTFQQRTDGRTTMEHTETDRDGHRRRPAGDAR